MTTFILFRDRFSITDATKIVHLVFQWLDENAVRIAQVLFVRYKLRMM